VPVLILSAAVDTKDEGGRQALHIASKQGHKQTVIALLERGSDINIMSKNNRTPLDFAMPGIHFIMKLGIMILIMVMALLIF
jgi:ankyrin repeat protein